MLGYHKYWNKAHKHSSVVAHAHMYGKPFVSKIRNPNTIRNNAITSTFYCIAPTSSEPLRPQNPYVLKTPTSSEPIRPQNPYVLRTPTSSKPLRPQYLYVLITPTFTSSEPLHPLTPPPKINCTH